MYHDPIVEEVHRIRDQLLAECGGDMDLYIEKIKEFEKLHPERLITKEQLEALKRPKESLASH
jgi:hypothetical protein